MGCQASAHAEFKFRAGDRVEARFRGRAKRFPATIAKARDDGTYDVRYDDGVLENRVTADLISEPGETRKKFKRGYTQTSKHAEFQRGYTQFNKALLRKPIHPFEVFKLCDRSGSGRICWEDFAAVCPLLGEPPSLDVFKAADTNHDGFVDYEEFEAMLRAGTCFGRPVRVDFIRIKQGDHLKAAASKGASTNQSEADAAASNLYEPAVEVGAKPTELATESELRAQLFGRAQR